MTTFWYAARVLALSLALGASGILSLAGPSPASAAAGSRAGNPVGGTQLAAPGVIVNLAPGVPPPPAMPGESYLVADMDTGQILVAKSPHAPHLPASTLKALTALTLIPILNPSANITVTRQDASIDGTRIGLVPGTTYTVGMLMQGMLMASGNDAAYALARGNQGVAATLKEMNATAALLRASDTVAKDPSGLDKAGQQSSAYDLALIGRAAMKLPDFRRYVLTKQATLPGGRSLDRKLTHGFKIGNHNRLLFNYPGCVGIKNGYTIAARSSFVEAATRGGKTYLLTEMDSPTGSWHPTAAMLDWAFAHGPSLAPIGQLVEPADPTRPTQEPTPAPAVSAAAEAPQRSLAGASSGESAHGPAFPASIGISGGIAVLLLLTLLVGAGTWRNISRKPH